MFQNNPEEAKEILLGGTGSPQETSEASVLRMLIDLVIWLTLLPCTIPLSIVCFFCQKTINATVYTTSVMWSLFCISTMIGAAMAIYIPLIGEKLAWTLLLPSKLDRIPQQPIVSLAMEMLGVGAQLDENRDQKFNDDNDRLLQIEKPRGEN